ncbi:Uncharacterized protein DAT39_014734 [Clarias magur]|uniref:Uncharacterized protein n=1 Tax=Clarias magur TaxID=1594786 RepID=A0A8J4WZ25_CLAMG|nr:Uncharacterized protein DAT39_014734 [Clarias magur]
MQATSGPNVPSSEPADGRGAELVRRDTQGSAANKQPFVLISGSLCEALQRQAPDRVLISRWFGLISAANAIASSSPH